MTELQIVQVLPRASGIQSAIGRSRRQCLVVAWAVHSRTPTRCYFPAPAAATRAAKHSAAHRRSSTHQQPLAHNPSVLRRPRHHRSTACPAHATALLQLPGSNCACLLSSPYAALRNVHADMAAGQRTTAAHCQLRRPRQALCCTAPEAASTIRRIPEPTLDKACRGTTSAANSSERARPHSASAIFSVITATMTAHRLPCDPLATDLSGRTTRIAAGTAVDSSRCRCWRCSSVSNTLSLCPCS